MSTRSHIAFFEDAKKIQEPKVLLYRNSDGYPSGVLPDIMPFLEHWSTGRGIADVEYCSARLLQYLCNEYDGYNVEIAKEMKTEPHNQSLKFGGELGHGICKNYHWDVEYLYAIDTIGVSVYDFSMDDSGKITKKLLGVIPFKDYEKDETYQKLTKE
jgi:hypothetical protein